MNMNYRFLKNFSIGNNNPIISTDNLTPYNNNKKEVLTLDKLIQTQKEKKDNLFALYKNIANDCEDYILKANNMGKEYVFYNVPETNYSVHNYNSMDCLTFVKKVLDNINIESYIVDNRTLYIDWKNIGDK